MIFKNAVRTAKKTQHFTITNINLLMPFKKINAELLTAEAGGTYSYHWTLKG
jgi:hypothetical protein